MTAIDTKHKVTIFMINASAFHSFWNKQQIKGSGNFIREYKKTLNLRYGPFGIGDFQ